MSLTHFPLFSSITRRIGKKLTSKGRKKSKTVESTVIKTTKRRKLLSVHDFLFNDQQQETDTK